MKQFSKAGLSCAAFTLHGSVLGCVGIAVAAGRMQETHFLIVPLLQGFFWFDDGLQAFLRKKGWGHVTRPQSMVMINILSGIVRPSDIARSLGISRQAIHATINQMVEMGMLEMRDDPDDGRSKIVALSSMGTAMRKDANAAVEALTAELSRRIGKANIAALSKAFAADWGEPPLDPDALKNSPRAAPAKKAKSKNR